MFRFPHFGLSGIFLFFYCFSEFDNNLPTPKTHNVNTPTAPATVQLCSYGAGLKCAENRMQLGEREREFPENNMPL